MKKLIVVGDRFEAFARNKNVLSVSALEERLRRGDCTVDEVFELGQGVAASRVEALLNLAESQGRREQMLFLPVVKCGAPEVHKTHIQNSMLSVPVRKDTSTFEAELLLDDQAELLSDHLGGQHLPGMILIEAIRQMGLAVVELFFADKYPHGCAFLWTSIQVTFNQYAFPIPTTIMSHVRERTVLRGRREAIVFAYECLQRGNAVATCQTAVELHDRRVVERQEKGLAAAMSAGTAHAQLQAEQ